jgi:hypothetical protein
MAEALSKTPDHISKRPSWRKEYEESLQRIQVENEKQEEDHLAYLNDFLAKHGRLPTLEEDKFSKGLEMFILTLRGSQKRRQHSETDSKANSEEGSEYESELDDGAVEDSELDPGYKDC